MTGKGGPAFRCCGGDLVQTGGRPLSAARAGELLAWFAAAGQAAGDPEARAYLERRRTELDQALEAAKRWRRAAAAAPI